jgi:large repetitive protein
LAPAAASYQCLADVPAPGSLTATDNCSPDITVTGVDSDNGGAGCADDPLVITRTWTFADACGNSSSVSQTITVIDDIAPVAPSAPAAASYQCLADVPAPGSLTATDNCSPDITVTGVDSGNGGAGCADDPLVITRTWTFADACGNSSSVSQTITVIDDIAPVAPAAPAAASYQCLADVPAPGSLTATDNCSPDITVTGVDSGNGGAGCADDPLVITRTWTFADACGNSSSVSQTITVIDDIAPVAPAAPAAASYQCLADVPAPGSLTATDNCSPDITATGVDSGNGGAGCADDPLVITRTWTFADACGNSSSVSQTITVIDDIAPVAPAAPAAASYQCLADVPAPGSLTATDNCSPDITATGVDSDNGGAGCASDPLVITRTWTFADACGNSSSVSQTITVIDDIAPVAPSAPAAASYQCLADVPAPGSLTATDNCSPDITATGVDTDNGGAGCASDPLVITRTWTFADACGNSSSVSQTITVIDDIAPVAPSAPAAVSYQCLADVPAPGSLTATDNCSPDITATGVDTDNGGAGCASDPLVITRTWTFADACGNSSSVSQTITVIDDIAPVAPSAPAAASYQCLADVPAPGSLTATDNCSPDITATGVDTDNGGAGCASDPLVITRTWTFADACGNSSSVSQTITVIDTQAPTLVGVPTAQTVDCNAVPTPAKPSATDNCDPNPIITFVETRTDGACADSYTLTRTWTATDACGNSSAQSQVITVQDTQAPTLSGVPDNTTVECDAVPAPAQPMATDNCDPAPQISFSEVRTDGACADSYTLTRTWTATDACGNSSAQSQVITVQDTQAPTLSGVPDNTTVECDAVPAPAQPTATDNCDPAPQISFSEVRTDGDCADSYTLTRTWTATDACGNSSAQSQVITVQDTQAPTLSGVPDNTTVECDAVPAPAQPMATDNCDPAPQISFSEVRTDGACADSYTLTRTWTATDACGNSSAQSQVITVQDTQAPTLSGVPDNTTVECDAVPAPAQPTATDNCDPAPQISFSEVRTDGDCADSYTLTRTWTATDACGNSSAQSQVITVQDTQAPTLSGVPDNTTVECDAVPAPAQPTATDNCDPAPQISFSEVRTDGDCADSYTLTRTWTATDACGNSSAQSQVITVQDTQAPTLSGVPDNTTVECDAVPAPAQPTATDNCDPAPQISFSEVRTDGACADSYTLTRTWTATDACGNSSAQSQVITVQDTQAPTLSGVPDNTTVECDAVPAPAQPTATDNCDPAPQISFSEVRTDGDCADNYTLTRTWTATDRCGNSSSATQVITVQDTQAPTLSGVPDNTTVECDAVPAPAQPTATDNCDPAPQISFSEVRTDGDCADSYTLTRTWTATDACGNSSAQSQVITVQDTQAPTLSGVPDNTTVECDAVPAPAQPTATDNCDPAPQISFSEVRTDGACADSYTLTRTWTATDACGNSSAQSQVITVQDTQAPTLSGVPDNTTVECDAVPAPAQPTATDNCDPAPQISFSEVRTDGDCADNYTLTRTWTATDRCGNSSSATQVITVQDTQAPTLSGVPDNTTVECDAVPAPAQPTATDNCDPAPQISFSEVRTDGDCADSYTLTRTWTATDACGNSSAQSQVITVQDTQAPTLSGVPDNTTVECDAVPAPAQPTATDNCDPAPQISFSEVRTDGDCADSYTLTRTWTATDRCGNSSSATQVITVQDTQAPTLSGVPDNTTVECDAVPAPAQPTATDNCDPAPQISFSEVRTDGDCADSYTLTRTWTATDACGNSSAQTQVITVQDTQAPTLSGVPDNTTVECDAVPAPAQPTATDNCDPAPQISFSEVRTDGDCADNYTLTRTWTATDACGNSSAQSQVITVQDTQAPTLSGVPANTTVQCDAIPEPASPTASDNCDPAPMVSFSEVRTDGACADSYTLTRTWTATDRCGNSSAQSQVITVQDTQAPTLSGVPANTTVQCDAIPEPASPTASDNCDPAPMVSFSEVRTDGACADSYTLTRTWTATDRCGNSSAQSQVITVQDTQAPTLSGVPANTTVQCDAIPEPASPTASDNCDPAPMVSFSEVRTDGDCADNYTLTRTWTATDRCGNSSAQTQVITVQDTQAPTLSGVPDNTTVECDAVPAPAQPTATDNCDPAPQISFSEVRTDGAARTATR